MSYVAAWLSKKVKSIHHNYYEHHEKYIDIPYEDGICLFVQQILNWFTTFITSSMKKIGYTLWGL